MPQQQQQQQRQQQQQQHKEIGMGQHRKKTELPTNGTIVYHRILELLSSLGEPCVACNEHGQQSCSTAAQSRPGYHQQQDLPKHTMNHQCQ